MREEATLSRRAAAALPLAALLGPAAAMPPIGGADAELLELGRRWLEIRVAHVAHWRAWQALPEVEQGRRDKELNAECEAMSFREWALEKRIHAITATSIAGIAVKARIVANDFDAEDIDIASIERLMSATDDSQSYAALSLALDVLKLVGAKA